MARKNEPEWADVHAELAKHKSKNLQYIWEEYCQTEPEGLSYSQFCEKYRRYRKVFGKGVTMHQDRLPGEILEVDWMGDLLPCVKDTETNETIDAHFFVGVLGDSGMPFMQAYPNEKQGLLVSTVNCKKLQKVCNDSENYFAGLYYNLNHQLNW